MRSLLLIGLIIVTLTACKTEDKPFNGYIDTDLVYLSADLGGRLVDLAVQRGQLVQGDQFLFKLEQTSELYQVDMSQLSQKELIASRQQIQFQLDYNETNYRRVLGMRKQNAASQNDLEAAKRDLDISKQQLLDADAKISSNQVNTQDRKWLVTRKENHAPQQGIIFDTYYTKGEYIQPGYPIVSLITRDNIKAIFFVPEEKLTQVRMNARVKISTDINPNFATGHIFYISNIAEYTPPIIYSREERHRLVFRVEAKVDVPDLEKIHLGQPVTMELS